MKRGVGFGPDINWHLGQLSDGRFRYYRAQDDTPGLDPNGKPIPSERQRIWFLDQATLRTNLTVKLVARYESDPFVVRDFFESEYRKNVQPSTFAEVNQLWSNFSLDVLAQPRRPSHDEDLGEASERGAQPDEQRPAARVLDPQRQEAPGAGEPGP